MGLDVVELVMAVEEEFSIEVNDEEAAQLATCGSLADYVVKQLRARGDTRTEDEVWTRLKDLIVEQLGVKADEVKREAKFYEDLGAG
ncbi:MAG: hypothetical protein B9S33_10280 [Pedosphaera sp. Tous-C6FEB]|nr:MAG: hypothetical protein B9S33_10280 [Pedosphaera sp. Tous-C6FEB]